jgi:hypothetical protein
MSGITLGTQFPSVPSMTSEAQDFVEDLLSEARQRAATAVETANATIAQLRDAPAPAQLPAPPTAPAISAQVTGSITAAYATTPNFGDITVQLPAGFTPDLIVVPDIASEIPEYVPLFTTFGVPDAPVMVVPDMPTAPAIQTEFDVGTAPVADYGGLPDLERITLPTFTMPTLEAFDDAAPAFNAAVPTEGVVWSEPTYQARLATQVQTALESMLAGGTGIPVAVERAIWERDRERLDATAYKAIDEATNQFAARGFPLPPGALNGVILGAQRDAAGEIGKASRDVAIKAADLEQANRKFAVEQGMAFERLWVDIFLQAAQRSFEIAKFTVEMRIKIFDAQVAAFNVEQAIFGQKIERFKAKLQFALAQIDAYKAQLQGEQIKAEINKELIGAFNAKVQAFVAQVQAFDALVRAAATRADLEKNKIELFRAEIEGRIAQVTAKKSEFDAYVARVQGESAKADLEKANAQAYSARVGAISAVADVTLKEADIKLGVSKQKLDYAVANLQLLGQEAQLQLGAIQARQGAFDVETRRASSDFEAKRATEALNLQVVIETGRTLIQKYQADIAQWTARVQQIIEFARINSTSIQAAGQIASNLAAGAMAGTSVSAGFQGGVSRSENSSESWGYQESKSENTSDSNSYSVSHIFNHDEE